MNTAHAHPERTTTARRRPQARPGFTIAELVTTIAVISLLTIAIGRIFQSVGKLTSLSAAVAETDHAARAIERRLRADIDALNRLPADQTYIVIRMREVGDQDRDGDSFMDSENTRGVYLSAADEDHDRQLTLVPYETRGANDELRSRAVTRRVDDVVFLAQAPAEDPYRTSQVDTTAQFPVSAKHARIYWGHALRAAPDPDFTDPGSLDDTTMLRVPVRQFVPDGDFAQKFADTMTLPDGGSQGVSQRQRNRFAADWALSRQATLLYGGIAAGNENAPSNSVNHPIGFRRHYAPYIRDTESFLRFPSNEIGQLNPTAPQAASMPFNNAPNYPLPRLMRHGRVDICAQDIADVRRWLEGEAPDMPNATPTIPPPFAGAFDTGRYIAPAFDANINAFLWKRLDNPEDNLLWLRSALAGTLARPIIDDERVRLDRLDNANVDLPPGEPEGTLMDAHALLATRCSNFEVAWSDGSRVLRDFTRHDVDYRAGDLIWFDISPVEDDTDPERSTYLEWWDYNDGQSPPEIEFRSGNPTANTPVEFPELTFAQMLPAANLISTGNGVGQYDPRMTGGVWHNNQNEAMAVWGFRAPGPDGAFNRPWPKPRFLRVRITLHDAQNRLTDGKQYEFVFAIHPDGGGA